MVQIELDVFSGRPNPTWQLDDTHMIELLALLADLPIATRRKTEGLGYSDSLYTAPLGAARWQRRFGYTPARWRSTRSGSGGVQIAPPELQHPVACGLGALRQFRARRQYLRPVGRASRRWDASDIRGFTKRQ